MRIHYSNEVFYKGNEKHSLFLVGPTPRAATVPSWRPEALQILSDIKYNGVVYVPEPFTLGYMEQIEWETYALAHSDVIAAWVCREMQNMPALTTNIEWGEWHKDPKFIYGRPDGAPHTSYMDVKYSRRNYLHGVPTSIRYAESKFGNKPHNNLRSLLVAATEGYNG